MARLAKIGVDYFPHYVGSRDQKTLFILKNEFGNDGYAFWYQLLEILGGTKDLSYDCEKPANWRFLTASTGVSGEKAEDILNMLVELEAIDMELWLKDRVIWCQDFADQLEPIYKKRRQEVPTRPMLKEEKANAIAHASFTSNEVMDSGLSENNEIEVDEVTTEEVAIQSGDEASPQKVVATNKKEYERKEVMTKVREPSQKKEDTSMDQSYIDERYAAPFAEWLDYKSAKGKPYRSPNSIKSCYELLCQLSGGDPREAMKVVSYSMANNYDGLFVPCKQKGGGSTTRTPDCLMNANSTQHTINRTTI